EDKIQVLPSRASLQLSFHLANAVLLEHLSHPLGKVNHAITALRFRVPHPHLVLLQIEILPLQTQKLITPYPCDKSQHDDRLEMMSSQSFEQLSGLLFCKVFLHAYAPSFFSVFSYRCTQTRLSARCLKSYKAK